MTPQSGTGPLAELENNGYSISSFTYPLNLTADTSEQHFMIFYINESSNTQFQTLNSSGEVNADGSSTTPLDSNGNNAQPTINSTDNTSTYNKRPIKRVSTAIALYMPPNIETTYSTEWDTIEGGAMAAGLKAMSENDPSIIRILKEVGIGVATNAAHDAKDFLQSFGGVSTDIEGGVSYLTRAARNPHMEMLFRSVGFREFQWDFKFTPRSEQEAIAVQNICKAFRFYQAPEIKTGDDSPRYYIYPAEFDIEFWSQGKQNTWINKISTCALTNLKISYTGAGQWTSFKSGKISGMGVETNLSLSFKELSVITKQLVLQNF